MLVPGQPNPLDLRNIQKNIPTVLQTCLSSRLRRKTVPNVCMNMEETRFCDAHESFTDLDLADAGKTASTAAGLAAIVAKAVLPGPTSLFLEL